MSEKTLSQKKVSEKEKVKQFMVETAKTTIQNHFDLNKIENHKEVEEKRSNYKIYIRRNYFVDCDWEDFGVHMVTTNDDVVHYYSVFYLEWDKNKTELIPDNHGKVSVTKRTLPTLRKPTFFNHWL